MATTAISQPDIPDELTTLFVFLHTPDGSGAKLCGPGLCHVAAVTRVEPTATAFPHRKPRYSLGIFAQWTDPDETDTCISWTRETFDALRPYMEKRVYVNYLSADEDHRVRDAYGPNYDRLVELKRRYDPDNLFRLNQNIKPNA